MPLFDGVQVYYAYLCIYNLAVDMQLPIKRLEHTRVLDIDILLNIPLFDRFILNLYCTIEEVAS